MKSLPNFTKMLHHLQAQIKVEQDNKIKLMMDNRNKLQMSKNLNPHQLKKQKIIDFEKSIVYTTIINKE
jgi:hypothetical protein